MFDSTKENVALIRKTKPKWQAGLLNGIGGKVERKEETIDAMVREFREETGFSTITEDWLCFASMHGSGFSVHYYCMVGPIYELKTMEEEMIEIASVRCFHPKQQNCVENLPWLLGLALDSMEDGRPAYAEINYP